MRKYGVVLGVLVALAVFNTLLLGFQLTRFSPWTPQSSANSTITSIQHTNQISASLATLQTGSVVLAPISWCAVLGVWVWRGRKRSEWGRLGLSEDLFRLLVKMRGAGTRSSILKALLTPKDRFQLARDLNLDWTTVDYHVHVLLKYGLVVEDTAYGNVKLYKLTPNGDAMLKALEEMERKEVRPTSQPG